MSVLRFTLAFLSLALLCYVDQALADEFMQARHEMVAAIEADVAATRFYLDKQTLDARAGHSSTSRVCACRRAPTRL